MPDLDNARTLLASAGKDLAALCAMGDRTAFADEIVGFHAQQVLEKTLKGWLAVLGQVYPYRHDLAELLNALQQLGVDVAEYWDLVELTDFGVRFRYEALAEDEPPLDRAALCMRLQTLMRKVGRLAHLP